MKSALTSSSESLAASSINSFDAEPACVVRFPQTWGTSQRVATVAGVPTWSLGPRTASSSSMMSSDARAEALSSSATVTTFVAPPAAAPAAPEVAPPPALCYRIHVMLFEEASNGCEVESREQCTAEKEGRSAAGLTSLQRSFRALTWFHHSSR